MTFCISCLFMAIVLLCIWYCSMYLQSHAEIYHCIVLMSGWFFHMGLHYSTCGMDFIMYFDPHVIPLTSHIMCICYNWFYHTWLITYLWPPLSLCRLFRHHGLILSFDVPSSSLKNPCLLLYATFNPILACTHNFWPQTRIHRDMCISLNNFGVFLIGVQIT